MRPFVRKWKFLFIATIGSMYGRILTDILTTNEIKPNLTLPDNSSYHHEGHLDQNENSPMRIFYLKTLIMIRVVTIHQGFTRAFSIRVLVRRNVVLTVICLDTLNWNAGRYHQVDL